MRYMLLIYNEEAPQAQITEQQWAEAMTAYNAFTNEVRSKGILLGSNALHPTTMATTVRVREGQTLVSDGPFAETKEALGGYYILNCKDLDEALAYAAKIPGAKDGSVEVRPIMEF
jgi:hypothetical protein